MPASIVLQININSSIRFAIFSCIHYYIRYDFIIQTTSVTMTLHLHTYILWMFRFFPTTKWFDVVGIIAYSASPNCFLFLEFTVCVIWLRNFWKLLIVSHVDYHQLIVSNRKNYWIFCTTRHHLIAVHQMYAGVLFNTLSFSHSLS